MRIAIVSFGFIEHTTNLANALEDYGDEVFLFLPEKFKRHAEGFVKKARVEYMPMYKGFKDPRNLARAFKLARRLRKIKPDAVVIESGEPWLCFFLRFLPQPIVVDLHDPTLHSGEEKLHTKIMQNRTLKHAKKVIVHGKSLKKDFLKIHPEFKAEDVFVMMRGPYSNYIRWKKKNVKEEKLVLFFGRFKKYKGIEYLAEAAPLVRKKVPGVKILVAGKGDVVDVKELESKGVSVRNEFIKDEDVAELFQRAAVVVLPYTDATQSAVTLISYAFEKPVVATNVGALPEVVFEGKTGFLVPARNSEAIASAIVKVLNNKAARKSMSRCIRRTYADWWRKSARETHNACAAARKVIGK
ncbi:MAG: glycosyltransferase family 4 protein [Candidatus Micrarchaeota archaeon]